MTKPLNLMRALGASAAFLAAGSAAAQPATQHVVFVSCPVLRDTALPCWLGMMSGELYYLGPQTDLTSNFYPPEFRHKMLVEADLADGPRVCGGVQLKNVHVSVLPQIDDTCNIMLPGEGYPDPPNNRGTGPSGVRGGPPPAPSAGYRQITFTPPTPPFEPKTFVATFDAGTDRKWAPAQRTLTQAYKYAVAVNASRIEITGYRAAIRLSSGQDYVEEPNVAVNRAKTAAEAFTTLGLPPGAKMEVKWVDQPVPSAGLGQDVDHRKAVVTVYPGAAQPAAQTKTTAAATPPNG